MIFTHDQLRSCVASLDAFHPPDLRVRMLRDAVAEADRLRALVERCYLLLEPEYGNACRNGYFPDVKPLMDDLRAELFPEGKA